MTKNIVLGNISLDNKIHIENIKIPSKNVRFEEDIKQTDELMNNVGNIEEVTSPDNDVEMKNLIEIFKNCYFPIFDEISSVSQVPLVTEVSDEKEESNTDSDDSDCGELLTVLSTKGNNNKEKVRQKLRKCDTLRPMTLSDLQIVKGPPLPEEEDIDVLMPLSNTENILRKSDDDKKVLTSRTLIEELTEVLQPKGRSNVIEAPPPKLVKYQKGRIRIPNVSEEDKNNLMVITKNDLKDFLQDNCINTQILIKEIRTSNESLIKHFQESVVYSFKEINDSLREMKKQKNTIIDNHNQKISGYEKIMKDNQEIMNVMDDLMKFSKEEEVKPTTNVKYRTDDSVCSKEADSKVLIDNEIIADILENSDNELLITEVGDQTLTKNEDLYEEQNKQEKLNKKKNKVIYHLQSPGIGNILLDLLRKKITEKEIWKMELQEIKAIHKYEFSNFQRPKD